MTFLTLPWHAEAMLLIDGASAGHQSCALIGEPGSGKTRLLEHVVAGLNSDMPDTARVELLPRTTTPTIMLATVLGWLGVPVPDRMRKQGVNQLMQDAARQLSHVGVRLLVIDEAQNAQPDAMKHLLWLSDLCRTQHGHAMAFVLVGTQELRDVLAETRQLGQRIPTVYAVPLLDDAALLEAAVRYSDTLGRCLRGKGKRQRADVEAELIRVSAGSIRRLTSILERADATARRLQQPVDLDALQMALETQAAA